MKHLIRLFASLIVPAFMLLAANPSIAQDKAKDAKAAPVAKAEKGKAATKVLAETDKVTFKTGEAKVFEASPVYKTKNEGKSDIVLYVVQLKEPKK